MATNKFFTWTKGTYDAKRRKPIPLDFDQSPDSRSSKKNRTNDSIALQDAAVQSATSLLAVMNDCLNSHLLSTQRHLKPTHGRPRSRTAPSTPMFEVPEQISPVELPGSMPLEPSRRTRTVHQSMDSKSVCAIISAASKKSLSSVERPYNSPQSQYALPAQLVGSRDSLSHTACTLQPPPDVVPRAQTTSPYQQHHMTPGTPCKTSDDTLVAVDTDPFVNSVKGSSLAYLASWHYKSPTILNSQVPSDVNSATAVSQTSISSERKYSYVGSGEKPTEAEFDLVAQIAAIRASHEEHVSSLRETHAREIRSYCTYIAILEKSRMSSHMQQTPSKQHLTIDTSHIGGGKGIGMLSSDASATTSLRSFESSIENQKPISSDAAETEALKRKLSLCRKAQSEHDAIRRERDQLRDTIEKNNRRIVQLKDIVHKAKESEKALKNAMKGLEATLMAANNERTDVLEGFYEACERLKAFGEKERRLIKERDELRNHLYFADPAWAQQKSSDSRPSHGQELCLWRTPTLREDPLIQTLDDQRRMLAEKDKRIQHLEHQASVRPNSASVVKGETEVLERRLAAVLTERDRYNSLLHAELRRQNRNTIQKLHAPTPEIEDEANATLAQRLKTTEISNADLSGLAEAKAGVQSVEALQQELKYCIQEIIMFKLDVKGYKKDLKQANAKIDALRAAAPHRHTAINGSKGQEDMIGQQQQSGLGISSMTHPPTTPQRTIANAITSALTSTTPTPEPPVTALSPAHRPVTPSGKHKKLPRPPPPSTSPSPETHDKSPPGQLQRHETLRSLSESIISSYARRNTQEQGSDTIPSARARSSEPSRTSTCLRTSGVPESATALAAIHTNEILQGSCGANMQVTLV